ncbi:MAG: FAD-linked oxidase C-terminal domain-containing protein [Nitrososphaerota archaeon]
MSKSDKMLTKTPEKVASDLRERISGDVLSEAWQRALYASDASAYFIMPLCVVLPRSKDDVVEVVKYASENGITLTARGGGSSLLGQSVGEGIIIDFSKYMNRILEINPDENYVVVEPGIYKSVLDKALAEYGKVFPPDPSSSDFCTIGGMISTNAAGSHTVKYGTTIDYILSLEVVLSSGEIIRCKRLKPNSDEWKELVSKNTHEARIYEGLRKIMEEYGELIRNRFPRLSKNSAGYRVDKAFDDGFIDLGRLFAASEGTLGIIVSAKLGVINKPKHTGLVLLNFDDLHKAGIAVQEILKLKPSAIEMVDKSLVDSSRDLYPEINEFIPGGVAATLYVEFDGGAEEIEKNISQMEAFLKDKNLVVSTFRAFDSESMKKLWSVRKKSLGFAYKFKQDGKSANFTFIEDLVVPPERLAELVDSVSNILKKHGLNFLISGHAGDGNVHIRPLLNLSDKRDFELVPIVASEVFELTKSLGGSISGEHGDGMIRAQYLKIQYGEELLKVFWEIKRIFDPINIMNPGKKLDLDDMKLEGLRTRPDTSLREIRTQLLWDGRTSHIRRLLSGYNQKPSLVEEAELCIGCGLCKGGAFTGTSRMCPVFAALGDEVDGCRGRINLLRWLLRAESSPEKFVSSEVYKEIVYEHCIQCRMCLLECTANVDVGKIMAEMRAWYSSIKGIPKGYGYLIEIDKYAKVGSMLAPVSNWMMRNKFFRILTEYLVGLDRNRNLPPFHRKTFKKMFEEYSKTHQANDGRRAVFFYDTYINYNDPELGMAIVKILELNGFRVLVPPQLSSGLPAINEGAPSIGRKIAEFNVTNLAPYARSGVPIVCFSPAASLALKHEYLDLLDTDDAHVVSENTYDFHEFLYKLCEDGTLNRNFRTVQEDVYVHLHCHTLVQCIKDKVLGLLELVPGLSISELEKGCCGSGGAFSFVRGNFEKSLKIGSRLFETVKQSDRPVYTTGELCKLQIEAGSGKKIGLTVDVLRKAYGV